MMSSPEEYKNNLLNFDLQSFLSECAGLTSIQLKKLYPDTYRMLAIQLALYPKAIHKLPDFTANYCYLTAKSYEQASSEAMADHKALLYNGNILLSLTGGLGIDDIAFSRSFKKVISIDIDEELNILTKINLQKLGINNIERVTAKAEDFIQRDISADLIYIDADRRLTKSGKKAVTLHDSSPDIHAMFNRLFEISGNILLKLSPLVDITYLKKTLQNIKEIRVISLCNEVKEILVLLDSSCFTEPEIIAVDITVNGKLKQFSSNQYIGDSNSEGQNTLYFFEPAPSLIKAGLVGKYADYLDLNPVSANNIYHSSGKLPADFFGRIFSIKNLLLFRKSSFNKYLLDNSITKANISSRNFPVKPEEIKKTFKLNDGGDEYFFFTTDEKKNKLVFHCRKD